MMRNCSVTKIAVTYSTMSEGIVSLLAIHVDAEFEQSVSCIFVHVIKNLYFTTMQFSFKCTVNIYIVLVR